jgi:LPS-assembly protein
VQLPNEDSALIEFDEGNLFALNRFSGSDARETGLRTNLGISWTRHDPAGWSMGLALGRVIRSEDRAQFGPASGLAGAQSDWLATMQLGLSDGARLTNRVLFDDDLSVTKAEMRLDIDRARYGLSGSYLWLLADPGENRPADIAELQLDGRYAMNANWTGRAQARYDLQSDRATSAGLALEFRNECMKVDLSLSRRFTSSTSVQPTTDFGLGVDLLGFGSGASPGATRACR